MPNGDQVVPVINRLFRAVELRSPLPPIVLKVLRRVVRILLLVVTVYLVLTSWRLETGTVFANRCDYVDPGLVWTGVKDTGKGATLSEIGYANLTQPKSYHLREI